MKKMLLNMLKKMARATLIPMALELLDQFTAWVNKKAKEYLEIK